MNDKKNKNSSDAINYKQLDELSLLSNLTRNQVSFWLMQRLRPQDTSSNMAQLYVFNCDIDSDRFTSAFEGLIQNADALRSTFSDNDGIPQQQVHPTFEFQLPIVDLSASEDARADAEAHCHRLLKQPFDLATRCFDSVLFNLGAGRWAWYLCVHHIVIDAYSINLIIKQVESAYAQLKDGAGSASYDLPAFSDYVGFERQYRSSERASRDRKFWSELPGRAGADLTLYGNKRVTDNGECARYTLEVTGKQLNQLIEQVEANCRMIGGRDMTVLVTYLSILTAFQVRAGSGQTVTVGVPFHNRVSRKHQATVGLLMEVIPLTINAQAGDTFTDICKKWRSAIMVALKHYRYGSINPLHARNYDAIVNLVQHDVQQFDGAPMSISWIHSGAWKEAITLIIQQSTNYAGDKLYLDLNNEIFSGELGNRAVDEVRAIIDSMAQDVSKRVAEEAQEQSRTYWADLLTGDPAPASFPRHRSEQPGETEESGDYLTADRLLPKALTDEVRVFAKAEGLSVSTCVHGAWAILLSRYTNSDEIVFGSETPAGADRSQSAETNRQQFPVRVALGSGLSIREWLKKLQSQLGESLQHMEGAQGCVPIAPECTSFDAVLSVGHSSRIPTIDAGTSFLLRRRGD